MANYLAFVARFPRLILSVLLIVTLYFAYMTLYLTEDSNPYLLPDNHPARSHLLSIREHFTGTYDPILLALHNPDGIINQQSLSALFELTQEAQILSFVNAADLEQLQALTTRYYYPPLVESIHTIAENGINQQDIHDVRRLATAAQTWPIDSSDKKYLRFFAERLDPVRDIAGLSGSENIFLEPNGTLRAAITVDSDSVNIEHVKRAIADNELFDNGIVNRARTVGLVVIEISILPDDAEGQLRAYQAVNKLVADYQQKNPQFTDSVFVGGVPVFFAEQKHIIDADMSTLFPAVIILVACILAIFFRAWLGVLIPLVNVVMCTIWTLGTMAIVGIPLDLITSILPVFLITICSSDAIHMMAEYYRQRQLQTNQQQVIAQTMGFMVSPVVLTTITTCVTFILSTLTSITNLRNFGVAMSFGMFVAMIISLLLIPAWLSLLSDKKLKNMSSYHPEKQHLISQWLLTLIKPIITHRKPWLLSMLATIGLLLVIATQVRIDDMGSGYFAENNRFRIADEFINSHIAGTSPGWIEIDTGVTDGALTLETVQFVDRLEKFIHEQEHITYSYSLARYVRRINYVLNNMDESYNRLPNTLETFTEYDEVTGESVTVDVQGKDIIRQAILLYENGGGADLTNVLSRDFSKTLLLYTMNTTVASDYQDFLDELKPWLAENIPEGMHYQLAGSPVVWTAVLNELLSGQLLSIFLAFICVIVIMGLWLRSWRMGLLGTLPLAITVVFYYATMTLFSIELNIGTAIISFLVLGVVDYSVHYLLRIQNGIKQGLSLDGSIEQAIAHSGRSIIVNVIVFSVGFVALLFSEFRPIVDLGRLVGFSLLISGVMSIFVITLLAPWFIPVSQSVHTD
jgi:predicted RND superfamily exporter protein